MSLHFKYQISTWRNLLGAVLLIAFAIGVAFFANSNDRGLRLFRLLTFSPQTASGIYWAFAAIFTLGSLMLAVLAVRSLNGPILVALENTHLVVPSYSMKGELLSIPYSKIHQVSLQTIHRQQIITIYSSSGRGRVLSIGFQSLSEFIQFKEALASRLNG